MKQASLALEASFVGHLSLLHFFVIYRDKRWYIYTKCENLTLLYIMENKEKQNGYSHIMKYTGLFGGIQMLNMLVGVVRNKMVAMILGPGGMGLLSLFNSTIKLVSESTNMGISMSGVKTISQNFDDEANDKLCESVK